MDKSKDPSPTARAQRVYPAQARQTAQVTFEDGRLYEAAIGTPLADYVRAAHPQVPCPYVAALVDGELEELSIPVVHDVSAKLLDTATGDGMRIYQRSVCFMLVVAVRELFPEADVAIDYAVPMGGFYCEVVGHAPFTAEELAAIEQRMREIVDADEPIVRRYVSVAEAGRLFAEQGFDDKVRLLAYRQRDSVPLYTLHGVHDYYYGYMAHSTGQLRWFGLRHIPPGFVLQLPRRDHPRRLLPPRRHSKITRVFQEYGHWLNLVAVRDVAALNQAVETGRGRQVVLISEALHEQQTASIADRIQKQRTRVRLVLIAGPSSSGKTTFARRLAIQLMANGLRPYAIELDNYFVDREHTPRDASGEYDFEALEAINLDLLNAQLQELMAGKPVALPRFDFRSGTSLFGEPIRLPQDAIIVLEGIHGLNPRLLHPSLAEHACRIYVSALTQLNIDQHNRVPTTDTRLLRRIVRDAQFRGYSAQQTIDRWESVRRGEERSIFPYQEQADLIFNTALAYELAVLKPLAEPLLLRVPMRTAASIEARRLLSFLQWVRPWPIELVPRDSLLREFVGGSVFQEPLL